MSLFELFSASRDAPGGALLNWCHHPSREIIEYAQSYRGAAMNLVAFLYQRGDLMIDYGALPIVFLYRHSLELYLKAIVYRAAVLTVNEQELKRAMPRLWREHSLERLVKMGEPVLLAKAHPLTQSGDLHRDVISLARRIDEVDPGSYSFRYPVTSQGDAALPKNVLLNIHVFSEAIEKVLDDVAHFCRSLESERLRMSEQMKLALHPLLDGDT